MRICCRNCGFASVPDGGGDPQRIEELKDWLFCEKARIYTWPADYCSHHPALVAEREEAKKGYKGET